MPDYSRLIGTFPNNANSSYTATEDCWLIGYMRGPGGGVGGELVINNTRVADSYTGNDNYDTNICLFLPKGTVVSNGPYWNSSSGLNIFGCL